VQRQYTFYSDDKDTDFIISTLESNGHNKVTKNGVEYSSHLEKCIFSPTDPQRDTLPELRIHLAPDVKDEFGGITAYYDGKRPQWQYKKSVDDWNFYPELMAIAFAHERKKNEDINTYFVLFLPDNSNIVIDACDERLLYKSKEIWYRPHIHAYDKEVWNFIRDTIADIKDFGFKIKTDLNFERNGRSISADLCYVDPFKSSLPTSLALNEFIDTLE
jgi:hypothetical protein